MLLFKDFVPRQLKSPGFFKDASYESFDAAVQAAGAWLNSSGVELVQLETVVLPNIWSDNEEGSADPALRTAGELSSQWHQFVRCWYRS